MAAMRPIPEAMILPLLELLPPKAAAAAALMLATGRRVSEILSLRRRDVLTPEGEIRPEIGFPLMKKRNSAERKICTVAPVYRSYLGACLLREEQLGHAGADDWVFRGQRGRHLSRSALYRAFRRVLGPGYGTHSCRKAFAGALFRELGGDFSAAELVRREIGHARLESTVIYLGVNSGRVEAAKNAIAGRVGGEDA